MLPSVYGCSAQQTATPTLTTSVSGVNWTTQFYGENNESKVAIPVEQQIASSVNSGNSWTMPENGIAYQYSEANPLQIQHSTVIQYDSSELSDSDLPSDGSCGLRISIISNTATSPFFGVNFANSGITRYPSKGAETSITIAGLNRSDVNAGATTNCPEILIAGIGGANLTFDPPDGRPVSLRNYSFNTSDPASGFSGTLQYKVQVLLSDGTYTSAGFQSITVPANAIKQYVFEPPVWTLSQVQTVTVYGTPDGTIGPTTPIPVNDRLTATLNTGNNFEAGVESFAQNVRFPPSGGDPEPIILRTGHSFQVTYDTSPLNLADFPEEVEMKYVITPPAEFDPTQIGFVEDGLGATFECSFGAVSKATYLTGGSSVAGPIATSDNDSPFNISIELNLNAFNVRVEFQATNGIWYASQEQPITLTDGDSVIEELEANP